MEPWLLDGGALELYQPPATTYWGFYFIFFPSLCITRHKGWRKKKGRVAPALVPTLSRGLAQTPKRFFFLTFFCWLKFTKKKTFPGSLMTNVEI
jgi:hypothetical protein